MKTNISILFVLILSSLSLQGQNALFDLSDTKWVAENFTHTGSGTASTQYFELYTTTDTIIDDVDYTKLTIRNLCSLKGTQTGVEVLTNFSSDPYELGALRVDGDQVYFYPFEDTIPFHIFQRQIGLLTAEEDHLLYDFSAEVGDTVFYSLGAFDVILDKWVNSEGLRVFEVTNNTDESFPHPSDSYISENMGSGDGLFASYYSNFASLECYASDEPLDAFACTPCGEYITNTEDESFIDIHSAVLYPNPAFETVRISESYIGQIDRIRVFDLTGQLVEEMRPGRSAELSLNFANRSTGVFVFQYNFVNGKYGVERIVVGN